MDQNPPTNQPGQPIPTQPIEPLQAATPVQSNLQPTLEPITPPQQTAPQQAPMQPTPPPLEPPKPASSFSAMRVIGLSFGVLLAVLAVAYAGFYFFVLRQQKPTVERIPTPTKIVSPSPTPVVASPAAMLHYVNTAYGYGLDYPADLQVIGEGLQVTNTTAPDVTFTTSSTAATPNPLRVFHITVKDKSLLTVNSKPISSYTPMELINMDLQATMNNKNIYVSTLAPVTQLQPLPKNILSGYSFSVRAKGYQTTSDGVLWDLGNYVITEFDSTKYHYVIVYSATDEMQKIIQTMQFSQ